MKNYKEKTSPGIRGFSRKKTSVARLSTTVLQRLGNPQRRRRSEPLALHFSLRLGGLKETTCAGQPRILPPTRKHGRKLQRTTFSNSCFLPQRESPGSHSSVGARSPARRIRITCPSPSGWPRRLPAARRDLWAFQKSWLRASLHRGYAGTSQVPTRPSSE